MQYTASKKPSPGLYHHPTKADNCGGQFPVAARHTAYGCSFCKIALTVNSDPGSTVSSRFH